MTPHVAREAQFDGQVEVLRLVAGEAHAGDALLGNVVAASADAILRIVALGGKGLNLTGVDGHHLPHAHVAQGDADGAEKVFGTDAVGIPFGDGVGRSREFILLAVGKLELFVTPLHLQLAFRLHAVDGLVVEHAAIVAEEDSVLACDIDQHRREPAASRAALRPQRRPGAPCVEVAAAAGISGIDRPQPAAQTVTAGTHVVVEVVSLVKAVQILARNPRCFLVVSLGRGEEVRGRPCRQGETFGHLHIEHVQPFVVLASRAGQQPHEQKGAGISFY